jgi:homocysteine S-methyltransferase
VAASAGPYGAVLADGSEYRGRYGLSVRALAAWHRPRLEALAEAGPDVLALETVPDIDEAEALMAAIDGLGIPAWLSYSIAGERTCAGQPLPEAFAVAAGVPEVVAVGVNCCAPADVLPAIAAAREATGKPVIVYPNSGEAWDARRRAWTGRPRYSAGLPRQWIAAGARIAGGCCRVRPADIAVIAEAAADAELPHQMQEPRARRGRTQLTRRKMTARSSAGRSSPASSRLGSISASVVRARNDRPMVTVCCGRRMTSMRSPA